MYLAASAQGLQYRIITVPALGPKIQIIGPTLGYLKLKSCGFCPRNRDRCTSS